MAIKSKFYTKECPLCKKPIFKGAMIDNKNPLGKWAHVECPVPKKVGVPSTVAGALAGVNTLVQVEDTQAVYVAPKNFTPSVYQLGVFDFIVNLLGNGVVEAVAGSGKTTTIIQGLEYIPLAVLVQQKVLSVPVDLSKKSEYLITYAEKIKFYLSQTKIAFLAYNKHIASTLKEILRTMGIDYVHASTVHSLGYSATVKKLIGIELDKDKVGTKMDDIWPITKTYTNTAGEEVELQQHDKVMNRIKRACMRKLVSIIKNTLTDYHDPVEVQRVVDFYGIDLPVDIAEEVLANLPLIMNRCKADTRTMDYDDMIWLPIVCNWQLEKFDYMLVDEGQDLNKLMIEFIMRSLADGGRMIIVGDSKQSLYGFRGADVEAIPRMIKMLDAKVLPLSITYRCPSSHVALVQSHVPGIQAREGAIEGVIENLEYERFLKQIEVGDMVVCRINAALVKPAFEAIRQGKKAIIRGKDIGRTLVDYVRKFEANDLGHLDILMSEHTAIEYERLINRAREIQAEMILDQYETIKSVADNCKTIPDLISKMEMLFDDSNAGIVFSSVHRAKGLEAENVFILRRDLLPHPKAKQDWEKVQEDNCFYVAHTRSKKALYFVKGEF